MIITCAFMKNVILDLETKKNPATIRHSPDILESQRLESHPWHRLLLLFITVHLIKSITDFSPSMLPYPTDSSYSSKFHRYLLEMALNPEGYSSAKCQASCSMVPELHNNTPAVILLIFNLRHQCSIF